MRFNLNSYLELREERDCAFQLYQDQKGLGQPVRHRLELVFLAALESDGPNKTEV